MDTINGRRNRGPQDALMKKAFHVDDDATGVPRNMSVFWSQGVSWHPREAGFKEQFYRRIDVDRAAGVAAIPESHPSIAQCWVYFNCEINHPAMIPSSWIRGETSQKENGEMEPKHYYKLN